MLDSVHPPLRIRVVTLAVFASTLVARPTPSQAQDPATIPAPEAGSPSEEVPRAPVPLAAAALEPGEIDDVRAVPAPEIGDGASEADASGAAVEEGPEAPQDDAPEDELVRVELHRNLAPPDGKKMMIAGGVVMGVGFLGQMGALGIIRNTCANTPTESFENEEYGDVVTCGLGFTGGAVLLFLSGIPELVGAPWIVAGATFRGRSKAFDDHFFVRREKGMPQRGYIWGGAGMIAGGALSWFISPRIAVNSCRSNPSITCSVDATTWGWNVGLGLLTAGGALLGRGLAYRRNFNRYRMLNPISVAPTMGRGMTGMALSGRF